MCGRFTLHTPIHEIVKRFSLSGIEFDHVQSYNIAPTQNVFTVSSKEQTRSASLMRWGLIPPWQRTGQGRPPLINARLETIADKPTFRRLVNSKRCLIIADGFFEWKRESSTKYPVYFTLEQGQPFAFAGLWEDGPTPTCTIITKEASSVIKPIHYRMPLILTPKTEDLWLSSATFAEIREHLPQVDQPLQYHRVSTFVNSPRNNEATCIAPIDEKS